MIYDIVLVFTLFTSSVFATWAILGAKLNGHFCATN